MVAVRVLPPGGFRWMSVWSARVVTRCQPKPPFPRKSGARGLGAVVLVSGVVEEPPVEATEAFQGRVGPVPQFAADVDEVVVFAVVVVDLELPGEADKKSRRPVEGVCAVLEEQSVGLGCGGRVEALLSEALEGRPGPTQGQVLQGTPVLLQFTFEESERLVPWWPGVHASPWSR